MLPLNRNPNRARCGRPAFTLIELLVVVGVTMLLLAIILPAYGRAREVARRTVCIANMKQIGVALFSYAISNKGEAPNIMGPVGKYAPRVLLSVPEGRVNLGLLTDGAVDDSRVFVCPSQTKFHYSTDFTKLGTDNVGGSYPFAVHVRAGESPKLAAMRHLAIISDDFVAPRGAKWGNGRYAHKTGYNVLYTDGSANWYGDDDQSIAKKGVYWDDETDQITYDYLFASGSPPEYGSWNTGSDHGYGPGHSYGHEEDAGRLMDIFYVWYSFCYYKPDPF